MHVFHSHRPPAMFLFLTAIFSFLMMHACSAEDWIGLDWIGLDWIGLDWIGNLITLLYWSQLIPVLR